MAEDTYTVHLLPKYGTRIVYDMFVTCRAFYVSQKYFLCLSRSIVYLSSAIITLHY